MDDIAFRRRKKHSFAAGRKTYFRVNLHVGEVVVVLIRPHYLVALCRNDCAALDRLPLGRRLVGIVGKIPSGYVDIIVRLVAYLDPVETGFAIDRLERIAIRRHYLVDREKCRRRNRLRTPVFRKRHIAVHLEHHRAPVDECTAVSRERHHHGRSFRNLVRAVSFRCHSSAICLDRNQRHEIEMLRNGQHAIRLRLGRLGRKPAYVAAADETDVRDFRRAGVRERHLRPFAICRSENRAVRLVFHLTSSVDRAQRNANGHVLVRIRHLATQGHP